MPRIMECWHFAFPANMLAVYQPVRQRPGVQRFLITGIETIVYIYLLNFVTLRAGIIASRAARPTGARSRASAQTNSNTRIL